MMPGLTQQMRADFAMLLASPDIGTAAVLHWREVVLPPGYDVNDESSAEGAEVTEHEQEFRCFFHQVDMRLSGYQRFAEIQTGDVILDYLADLALEEKKDHRVEVNGRFYTQKTASKDLLEFWETQSSSGGVGKVLLLTPAA